MEYRQYERDAPTFNNVAASGLSLGSIVVHCFRKSLKFSDHRSGSSKSGNP
jgi:hypothetical protein